VAGDGYPDLLQLVSLVRGNVGLVFTNENMKEIRDQIGEFKVPAAAKAGTFAPDDVWVPAGPTGMDPGQTAFFQSLGIATKIARGTIEILNDVHLIKKGDKVGNSEVALLSKLNVKPFTYGLIVTQIYDSGHVFDPVVLDITEADLLTKFFTGVNMLAALGLEINFPNATTVPHSLRNAFKKIAAMGIEVDYIFEQIKKVKEAIDNPDAFAHVAAHAHEEKGGHHHEGKAAAAAAADEDEEEEEGGDEEGDDDIGGGGLFGDEEEDDE